MDLIKIKLVIAYEGTRYQGWQVQTIGTGVQGIVECALARLFPAGARLHSSSRTDTGVHALGMVAHFEVAASQCRMPPRKLVLAVNAWLPEDVRVLHAAVAGKQFHARFDATGKEYRYQVWNSPGMNPLLNRMAWHVPRPLDLERMKVAATHFIGRHDFQSFAANPGYAKENTVRTLTRCQIRRSGALLTFILRGDGFLYKMCRGIVGTLVQVGLGKFGPEDVPGMLARKNRCTAGMSAPAHGLMLWKVFYGRRSPSGRAEVEVASSA